MGQSSSVSPLGLLPAVPKHWSHAGSSVVVTTQGNNIPDVEVALMALNIPWHHGSEVVTRMVRANRAGWLQGSLLGDTESLENTPDPLAMSF